MSQKRRQFSSAFQTKVTLPAAKGGKTLTGLANLIGVYPNQFSIQ